MRVSHRIFPLALLGLAAACGQGGTGAAQPNTMLTAATHDAFFPIAAGTKHALGSDNPAITCDSCHGGGTSFKQFDCLSCHAHSDQATLTAGHRGVGQFAYDSASCYSCHSRGTAGGALPPGAISDPAESATLTAEIPSYVDTSISTLTPRTETLPMPMLHTSANVATAAMASCGNCHPNAGMGAYYPGDLHLSLSTLNIAQPSACSDCHATSMPTGFVGPTATTPARNPASSEMKHDAVLWSSGVPTVTSIVTQDCSTCHLTPTNSMPATWATGRSGTGPALFHASLTAASLAQPTSCLDCHANTRPALLTSANATLPANLSFDHSVAQALGDCTTCHMNGGGTQWTSWSGGQFHLANSATPTTCLPCHSGERPTSTAGWVRTIPQASPFDYVPVPGKTPAGVTHGDGQDCVSCHAGPGTGAWGGTGSSKQNWVGGSFTHGAGTVSATTCFACHTMQRPDIVYGQSTAMANLPANFDHLANGTGDCFGCHQATVSAGSYVSYWDGTSANANKSDWKGGLGYPGSVLIGAPGQFITATEWTLKRSGTNNLVTSMSSILATLNNAMLHTSTTVPWVLGSGPDYTQCYHCHTKTNTATGSPYANGQFHSALTAAGLSQPTSQCLDCHAQMRPSNIVEKTAAVDLQPMDHNALFTSAVVIGGVSVTGVSGIECAVCHKSPGTTWTDGVFHANIGGAVPADCTTCHYPLMADAAKSDLTSGVNYAMKHTSSALTFQNCKTCHATALSKATSAPVSTLWSPGAFHPSVASQPTACLACHAISEPAVNVSTQSSVNYSLNMGGTSSNAAQWMNHGSGSVAGKDCVTCHAADAKSSGSAWSKSDSFHAAVTSPSSCKECHGLTNGGGSTPGTNNNLPTGFTNSTLVSSAAADVTTGVPSGTLDQINHADLNVSGHDCNFCHTQKGVSNASGVAGKEWAQASFHANFSSAAPLVMDGNTGRCSDCHMNVKPTAAFAAFDHSAFTATPGSQDCSSCHTWPGTGTPTAPNWLGAGAAPALVTLTGWGYGPPTTSTVTFAHPAASTYTSCAQCHVGSNYTTIIDYNHDGMLRNVTVNGVAATPNMGTSQYNLATNPTFCVACHSSNSPWVSRSGSSTITADTTNGSTTVNTPSTSALTLGMTISGTGIPNTTTSTQTITGATVTAGSTTVTTATAVSLRNGEAITGPGIPPGDTVAASVNNATSFTLTIAATASGTGVTLIATQTNQLTVTITAIPSATSITISSPGNQTITGTTLTVNHVSPRQVTIGQHGGSTAGVPGVGNDCTSCHYVGGRDHLSPPTPGVFGTGSISGG